MCIHLSLLPHCVLATAVIASVIQAIIEFDHLSVSWVFLGLLAQLIVQFFKLLTKNFGAIGRNLGHFHGNNFFTNWKKCNRLSIVSKWPIFQIIIKILVKLVDKLVIFTKVYFYELKEVQSIEYGVKITDFSNQ